MLNVVTAEVDVNALTSLGVVIGAAVAVYLRDRKTSSAAKDAKAAAAKARVAAEGTQTTVDKIATTQDERTGKLDAVLAAVTNNVDYVQKFADLAKQSQDTTVQMAGYLRDCEKSKAILQEQVNVLNVTVSQLQAKVTSLELEVAAGARRRSTDVRLDALSEQISGVAADQALAHERADAVQGPEGAAADAASRSTDEGNTP